MLWVGGDSGSPSSVGAPGAFASSRSSAVPADRRLSRVLGVLSAPPDLRAPIRVTMRSRVDNVLSAPPACGRRTAAPLHGLRRRTAAPLHGPCPPARGELQRRVNDDNVLSAPGARSVASGWSVRSGCGSAGGAVRSRRCRGRCAGRGVGDAGERGERAVTRPVRRRGRSSSRCRGVGTCAGRRCPPRRRSSRAFRCTGAPVTSIRRTTRCWRPGSRATGTWTCCSARRLRCPTWARTAWRGRLIRNGDWAWVTWSAVGGVDPFVAAHGLTDKQVIAATRRDGGRPARA